MQISWLRCATYEDAMDKCRVIYLHEWGDEPFYWGKAHESFFGGNMRTVGELTASGRYNPGYRHWIEGCLRHGAKLYIGSLDEAALRRIDEVENFLIATYGSVMNTRVTKPAHHLKICHGGDVPAAITRHHQIQSPADENASA
jgi:hypothetical protein